MRVSLFFRWSIVSILEIYTSFKVTILNHMTRRIMIQTHTISMDNVPRSPLRHIKSPCHNIRRKCGLFFEMINNYVVFMWRSCTRTSEIRFPPLHTTSLSYSPVCYIKTLYVTKKDVRVFFIRIRVSSGISSCHYSPLLRTKLSQSLFTKFFSKLSH